MDLGVSIWVLQHIPLLGVSLSGLYWHIWFGDYIEINFWGFGFSPNELPWAFGFAMYTWNHIQAFNFGSLRIYQLPFRSLLSGTGKNNMRV